MGLGEAAAVVQASPGEGHHRLARDRAAGITSTCVETETSWLYLCTLEKVTSSRQTVD